jgi:hypothetical protein
MYSVFFVLQPPVLFIMTPTSFVWDDFVAQHVQNWTWLWITMGVYYMPIVQGLQALHCQWKDIRMVVKTVRALWFVWNMALALFSGVGSYYTWQGTREVLLDHVNKCDWIETQHNWKDGVIGFFHMLFCVSKVFELGDTMFLAALGKPINFIHWYHHVLTMFTCYFLMIDFKPNYSLGMTMNFGVHAVMYTYYALSSVNMKLPKPIAQMITTIQTSQMLIMLGYTTHTIYVCGITNALLLTNLMYFLYLVLFMQYFVRRYNKVKVK